MKYRHFLPILLFIFQLSSSQIISANTSLLASDSLRAHRFFDLAVVSANATKHDSSIYYYNKALPLLFSVSSWEKAVNSHINLVRQFYHRDQPDSMIVHSNKAVEISLKHLGDTNLLTAFSYYSLGQCLVENYKMTDAIFNLEKALDIYLYLLGPDHPDLLKVYQQLGLSYTRLNDGENCKMYFLKKLDILLRTKGEYSTEVVQTYNNLGNCSKPLGEFEQGLDYLEDALAIALEIYDGANHTLAQTYLNIGIMYGYVGKPEIELAYLLKANATQRELYGVNHSAVAFSYNRIGKHYSNVGDYNNALVYLEKALTINSTLMGEINPNLAEDYMILCEMYSELGIFDKALEYGEKALEIRLTVFGDGHFRVGKSYSRVAEILYESGQYTNALDYYSRALNNFTKENKFPYAILVVNYYTAACYYELGDLENALLFCQKTISVDFPDYDISEPLKLSYMSTVQFHTVKAIALIASILFEQYKKTDDPREIELAYANYQATLKLLRKHNGIISNSTQKQLTRLEQFNYIFEAAIQTSITYYNIIGTNTSLEWAFEVSEYSKALTLQKVITASRAISFAGIPDSLISFEEITRTKLVDARIRLESALGVENPDDNIIDEMKNSLADITIEYERLLMMFEADFPDYYNLKHPTAIVSPFEIADDLGENTALIEYFMGASSIHIFTITNAGLDAVEVPYDSVFTHTAERFSEAIQKKTIIKNKTRRQLFSDGFELYQYLIKPIESQIASAERLIIIPDGLLHAIPFDALITKTEESADYTTASYLIKDYSISYHFSAALFSKEREFRQQLYSTAFTGFAPVYYNADSTDIDQERGSGAGKISYTSHASFAPLPWAKEEVEKSAKLFRDQNLITVTYFSKQGTEKQFREISDTGILHLATHGLLNDECPDLSCLIFHLADTTDFSNDGILYSSEIYNLDLNSDLIVLSSCQSGVGKIAKGDGAIAITRAFYFAGVPNILYTLWEISDKQTAGLMTGFYRNYLTGDTYPEALRNAKLSMISHRETAPPNYWASFQLIGR
ncbi:MAG: CHAT domain-containing protein [Candidatus Marinimicrobia bacterium]|nr:CHAT domain-containing protein [Candidatus Neomarinimicrobiota bacterium]